MDWTRCKNVSVRTWSRSETPSLSQYWPSLWWRPKSDWKPAVSWSRGKRGSLCFHTCTMMDTGRWKHRCVLIWRNVVWIYFSKFDFLISGYHLLCSISPWSASFLSHSKCSRPAFRAMVMANVWQKTKLLNFGLQAPCRQLLITLLKCRSLHRYMFYIFLCKI